MTHTILSVYKPLGKTPYEVIQKLKEQFPVYRNESITYAGRLDPLAHGVLLLLVGDAISDKDKFLSLQKTYECEAILGVETDSYDFLGFVGDRKAAALPDDREEKFSEFINIHIGNQLQSYPPFSSRTVNGKPLFWWTKNNRLNEIKIPQKEIEIYDLSLGEMGEKQSKDLQKEITEAVQKVSGDFRQEETLARWQKFFQENPHESFPAVRLRVTCSSGTYVRGLVHDLGKFLGVGAVTAEIFRTNVGEYTVEDSLRLAF